MKNIVVLFVAAVATSATLRSAEFQPTPRLVPVDPILSNVDPSRPRISFYYVGPSAGEGQGATLRVTLDGKPLDGVPLGSDRLAEVSLGASLAEGPHSIEASLQGADGKSVCSHGYKIIAKAARRAAGRRLNNFVTEVLEAPLADGEYEFDNPREGWVFIGFDKAYADAKAYLDGGGEPVVMFREDEPSETMRWLDEGTHRISVKGAAKCGGRIAVRLVKPLKITARSFANERTDVRERQYGYGFDFFRRHIFASFNTLTGSGAWRLNSATGRMARGNAELAARGKHAKAAADIRPHDKEMRMSREKIRGCMTGSGAYLDGLSLEVDEHMVNAPIEYMDAFAEEAWEMVGDGKRRALFADYCDLPSQTLTNWQAQVSALSALINTGDGHGMIVPEMYLGTKRTEEDAAREEGRVLAYVESIRKIIPAGPSHIIHLLGGWLTLGGWTSDSSPEADIKVRYDRYLHMLATDPAFADVGGVGMSTLACDEEVARWVARIVHHYCIEGRTEMLSGLLGYRYRPETVADGDFMEGLARWTVEPAEQDAIRTERRIGYGGKKGQCRMARSDTEIGEHFALFTRSEKAPNRLSQQLRNLEPGRLYMLTFCTADYDDVLAPGTREPDRTFSFALDHAEVLPDLSWDTVCPDAKAARKAKKAGTPPHCITVTHRVVFRAKSGEAKLTFMDWRSGTERGGEVGRRQLLNFVRVAPYYCEEGATCGRTVTVSKDFGFDPSDSTRFLQAALSSGAAKVIIDRQASDWITTSLTGAPNQTVLFEDGVTVRAKPGMFHGRADCLLNYLNCSNVTLSGYGATLKMERAIYDKPPYTKSEHRHTLNIRGCRNVLVEGLTCTESGGDGIFIGGGRRIAGVHHPPENITLKDVKCVRNYRQGLSVITVRGLFCDNCDFSDTGGTPPQSGIDFEPNWPDEQLERIHLRNCRFENNKGCGFEFYIGNLNSRSAPVTALFENCVTRGNAYGFEYQQRRGMYNDLPAGGKVELVGCTFEGATHAGVLILDKPASSAAISFRDCRVVNCCTSSTNGPDVKFATRLWDTPPTGGVDFGNLEVVQPFPRPKFSEKGIDWTAPGVTAPRFGEFDYSKAKVVDPAPGEMRATEGGIPAGSSAIVFYAEKPRKVTIRAQLHTLSRRPPEPATVKLFRDGKRIKIPIPRVPKDQPTEISFKVHAAGFYTLGVSAGRHAFKILEADVPLAVKVSEKPQSFAMVNGKASFWTDSGRRFALFAGADSYEKGAAKLRSPSGEEVWARNPITQWERFQPEAADVKEGLWTIELSRPKGMHRAIQLDLTGTPGFLFLDSSRYWH